MSLLLNVALFAFTLGFITLIASAIGFYVGYKNYNSRGGHMAEQKGVEYMQKSGLIFFCGLLFCIGAISILNSIL